MDANDKQIGGQHYKSALQHWDIVDTYEVPYLEGCATKYLSRWRKKNGAQDLEKAKHYVEKLIEQLPLRSRPTYVPGHILDRFQAENGIPAEDMEPIRKIFCWDQKADLQVAITWIDALIAEASEPTSAYVKQG